MLNTAQVNLCTAVLTIAIPFCTRATAQEPWPYQAVLVNGACRSHKTGDVRLLDTPTVSLDDRFGITEHKYWAVSGEEVSAFLLKNGRTFEQWLARNGKYRSVLDASFLENLENSKLLYFGQMPVSLLGELSQVFAGPDHQAAIVRFLQRGGVMFFDYFSSTRLEGTEAAVFLESVGAPLPGPTLCPLKRRYRAVLNAEHRDHPILTRPHGITGELSGFGYWRSPASGGQVLLVMKETDFALRKAQDDALHAPPAGLVVVENVRGNGTVFFSQVPGPFQAERRHRNQARGQLLVNILTHVYGPLAGVKERKIEELGGPGEFVE